MKPRRKSARLNRRGREGETEDEVESDDDDDDDGDDVYFETDARAATKSSSSSSSRKKKLPTRRKLEDAFERIVEKKGGKSEITDPFDDFEEEYETETAAR